MKRTFVLARRPRIEPGQVFARLTVLEREPNRGRAVRWVCGCECGVVLAVRAQSLRTENTRSCGCLRREIAGAKHRSHALSASRTYNIWAGMVQRCTNSNAEKWHLYGGRGIEVCERWMTAANFLADMGEAPEGMTLDRENNDRNYEPGNCRWVTQKQQCRNTRRTVFAELDGVRRPLIEWSELTGQPYSMLRDRLARGWDFRRALTEPRHA